MTPKELMYSVPDQELGAAVSGILVWRKTGVLPENALTTVIQRLVTSCGYQEEDHALMQIAENLVMTEAARRFMDRVL